MSNSLLWKIWTIEIDDLAIKRLVFHSYVSLPEGIYICVIVSENGVCTPFLAMFNREHDERAWDLVCAICSDDPDVSTRYVPWLKFHCDYPVFWSSIHVDL